MKSILSKSYNVKITSLSHQRENDDEGGPRSQDKHHLRIVDEILTEYFFLSQANPLLFLARVRREHEPWMNAIHSLLLFLNLEFARLQRMTGQFCVKIACSVRLQKI